ncbi:thioredoxin [bacterium BMS3Abin02]|nr:thioredoxin [bacterium BMS3Abin02]GBE21425.1 thioredoxin [bacterium BMS3Bbin01]HDK45370.1 thioredoxin [Actinomycetota bacterium]
METTSVKNVDAADFSTEVLERSREVPVVVDFWAPWCGPCRVLGPTLERLADEYDGGFELAKLDVDTNQSLAGRFQVQGIPTVIAFRDGEPVDRFTGALPEAQIRAWLRKIIPSEADKTCAAALSAVSSGDVATAERLFREVLAVEPTHEEAAIGLADLLVTQGLEQEALALLDPLPPTPEVQRLQAMARIGSVDTSSIDDLQMKLADDPGNGVLLVHLGRALSAAGRTQEALDALLHAVTLGGEPREEGRKAMLDIFEILGPDDPLTGQYRRKLASALF